MQRRALNPADNDDLPATEIASLWARIAVLEAENVRLRGTETSVGQEFLSGGGEMGALMRAHDWSTSSLGPPETWSPSLCTIIGLMLSSKFPMFLAWGPEQGFLYNDAYAETLGAKHPKALGQRLYDVWAEIWSDIYPLIERALTEEAIYSENLPLLMNRLGYDEQTWFTFSYSPIRDETGGIGGMFCACTETTRQVLAERRQAFRLGFENRLRGVVSDRETMAVASELLGAHFPVSRAGYAEFEMDGEHVHVETDWCAPGVASVAGRHHLNSFGSDFVADYQAGRAVVIDNFDTDRRSAGLFAAEAHHGIGVKAQIVVPLAKNGRLVALLFVHSAKPHRWSGDDVTLIREVADRTWLAVERARALAALSESEARFRAAVQAVSGVIWTNNADGRMEGEQPGWAALTGQAFTQYQGYGWADAVHPEDANASVEAWDAAVAERKTFIFEHRVRCADGNWRHFAVRAIPVLQDCVIREWVGVHTDITDQREAQTVLNRGRAELEGLVEARTAALLHEVEERRRLEEALRQSEKLQAIGQLTGGIAHDFNNIMQVVTSGTSLLELPETPHDERTIVLDGIAKAARNAKELTDRLLSFARKRTLQPETFDLNARLGGMSELLRRTLGSRINVKTDFAGDLEKVMADPSQLEVSVLNLAVNARDAMLPEGGTLTLQSRNAWLEASLERPAGDYVCLAITDTGHGMSPAVIARAFEPFFTTKGPEKGTGLGLAQVHGFAKQSGGDIAIESILGQGTTITLHLPRATGAMLHTIPTRDEPSGAALQRADGKTVLVVDDNPDVAAFAASMLRGLGYSTLTAADAASALALLEAGEPVDAVFSDVVMPGDITGVQLAKLLRLRYPHLALVLATGYSEVLADGGNRTTAEVLGKPYRLNELAAALDRAFAATHSMAREQPPETD